MRIAILADIHGNLPAFEAALEHVARMGVDQIIIAGDLVNGCPDSAACWELARTLDCPILRGNHERYAMHYGTAHAPPLWSTLQFAPLHWTRAQLTDQAVAEMEALPLQLRLPHAPDTLFVHASARGDYDTIAAYTPESQLEEMFAGTTEHFLIRAHNHAGQVRLWGDRLIITAGSVGLPLDGDPTAQYLLLDHRPEGWHVRHQSVPYDLEATLRRFPDTGYLAAAGPIAYLFQREVATASFHLVPFFRAYARWSSEETLSLAEAVERFLDSVLTI